MQIHTAINQLLEIEESNGKFGTYLSAVRPFFISAIIHTSFEKWKIQVWIPLQDIGVFNVNVCH